MRRLRVFVAHHIGTLAFSVEPRADGGVPPVQHGEIQTTIGIEAVLTRGLCGDPAKGGMAAKSKYDIVCSINPKIGESNDAKKNPRHVGGVAGDG